MRPITVTVGNLAVAGNATALRAATIAPAGSILATPYNAGVGVDRNILVTFAAAEPGLRIELSGQNTAGYGVSETIYGPAAPGTVLSVNQYNKVTLATSSRISLGAVSIGTSSIGTSQWVAFDPWSPGDIAIQCTAAGTVNYTVQSTLDNPADIYSAPLSGDPALVTWVPSSDTAAVGATATIQSNFLFLPQFARILLNSGTGLVTATFAQSGSS